MWLVDKIKIARKKKYITFEDITREWLEIKRKTLKKSSHSNYRYSVNKYLFPEFRNNYSFKYRIKNRRIMCLKMERYRSRKKRNNFK